MTAASPASTLEGVRQLEEDSNPAPGWLPPRRSAAAGGGPGAGRASREGGPRWPGVHRPQGGPLRVNGFRNRYGHLLPESDPALVTAWTCCSWHDGTRPAETRTGHHRLVSLEAPW